MNPPTETLTPAAIPATAAHDNNTPPALLDFMVTQWDQTKTGVEQMPEAARFCARRDELSRRFPGDVLVIPTGHEKTRANDTAYRFRPGTDFYYLTGNLEADCVLVLFPEGKTHRAVAFVEPNPGKTDATFYTDRVKGELWVGPRLGVPESAIRFGLEARALGTLHDQVATASGKAPLRTLRGIDFELESKLAAATADDAVLAAALSEMRLIKDDYEIGELQKAIDSTKNGFDDVLASLARAKTERYVEGVFNLRARVEGNDVGYNTIAASGRHACTLHWTANDGDLHASDLLLLDAGVEAHTLYTADVTRTVPLGGTFTKEQRAIYEIVLEAQNAGFAKCKPGEDFMAPNIAAMNVIAHGLERLGILPMSAEEALRETNQFYKRYSLHNVSHMLGIDVHDCAQARAETYKFGKLEAGMVLTVEPGIYLQPDDLTVPPKYRGIGVRIEDDVLITSDGYCNLSAALPRDVDAVEAWVQGARTA